MFLTIPTHKLQRNFLQLGCLRNVNFSWGKLWDRRGHEQHQLLEAFSSSRQGHRKPKLRDELITKFKLCELLPNFESKITNQLPFLNFVFFVPSYLNVWRYVIVCETVFVFTCYFKPVCYLINIPILSASRCNDYVSFYDNDDIIQL